MIPLLWLAGGVAVPLPPGLWAGLSTLTGMAGLSAWRRRRYARCA